MPRQSLQYPPARRGRGSVATRPPRRPRQPARSRYQNPYGGGYGPGYGYGPVDRYGRPYRSKGAYNRAQAARFARGTYKTARFTFRLGRAGVVNRRRLAALYAVTTLAAAGVATAVMPSGVVVATVAGAAPSVWAGVRRYAARRRGDLPALTAGQRAGWAARLATAAWLPLTAAFGFAGPLRLAWAAASTIGIGWWHLHTREGDLLELEEPERVGDDELDPISARWLATLGRPGGMLAGSYLVDPQVTENGWQAVVQLDPGRQKLDSALAAAGHIASAYGVDVTRVMLERMPDGRADQVALALYQANPLTEVREFTAPTLDPATGWVTIGTLPDGSVARWRLFEPGSGPCGGMIFGAQGSGKSALANAIAAEIAHSGIGVLWLADGQEGLSMPDWSEHGARWFAFSLRETRRMLQAAEQVMYDRQKRRRRVRWVDANGKEHRGKASFDGTRDEPYLYVLVDEWPIVALDPECRRIVALLLKAGRKVGITVIVIGQIPSIAEFGGDSDASVIRALSSTTNVVMFRIAPADKSSQHMGGMGVEGVDPTSIPAAFPNGTGTQGLGYVRAPGGSASTFRSNYVRDPLAWSETAPDTDLEDEAIDAAGEHYLDWQDRYALVLDGEDDPADEAEDEQKAQTAGHSAPLARIPAGQARAALPALPAAQVADVVPINLREGAVRILRGVGQVMSTAQISTHLGALTGVETAVNSVTNALKRAAEDGEVLQLPPAPGGKDRSARWIAAEYATEEQDA